MLLPLCESAVHVRSYIKRHSQFEFGLVSQAFCSALKQIVRDFDVLVAQLEHKHIQCQLSLQKLIYLLQPSKITMQLLEKLCLRVGDSIGGAMIDALHQCLLEQGDSRARELHLHLLTCAAEPFLAALSTWICRCAFPIALYHMISPIHGASTIHPSIHLSTPITSIHASIYPSHLSMYPMRLSIIIIIIIIIASEYVEESCMIHMESSWWWRTRALRRRRWKTTSMLGTGTTASPCGVSMSQAFCDRMQ